MPRWILPALAFGLAFVGRRALRRARTSDLSGQVALVTGSSRGLGLALARELARRGCRVVLCARDAAELERAQANVAAIGADVRALTCDVTRRDQVEQLVQEVWSQFGPIDLLIANAGEITVGPVATMRITDFQHAMDLMFWGAVYPIFAVLPHMRARRAGRIGVITSIGGKVSVPHLLAYSSAKFAAVGFSQGLRAELAREGIKVTTIVPGLMRTGSHLNASFKGQHRREYLWFSLGATLPMTSIAAADAARQIVDALARGDSEIILSWQARLLALAHGVAPGLVVDVLGVVNRFLPDADGIGTSAVRGSESETPLTQSPVEGLGRAAAADLNQTPRAVT
jgi:NAD(P)-dependent dehydrogenase (short-subunit alcohol dehydrogenase family)